MKKIKLDFIPTDIICIIGRKKYNKYVIKKGWLDADISDDAVTTSVIGSSNYIIIAIDPKSSDSILELKGLLAHEISHAITIIFENHGFNCDELRSYLLQHLYCEIIGYFDSLYEKIKI